MLARRSVLVLASCALTGGVVHVADEGMRTACATTIDGTNESHRRDCVRRLRRPGGKGAVCDEPRRVLITGISGMIGSHLARVLVAARCTNVYGLVRPRSDLAALGSEERSTSRRLAVFAPRPHWQAPNSETPARAWSQKVGGDMPPRPGV